MNIPKFTIVYNNGEVYHGGGDDDEVVYLPFSKKWLEAPSDGVSHINVENPTLGRETLRNHEFYYQLPLEHHGRGDIGASMKIGPYLRQLTDVGGIVKFGGWTCSANFNDCAVKAHRDTWVPKQSGARREQEEDTSD